MERSFYANKRFYGSVCEVCFYEKDYWIRGFGNYRVFGVYSSGDCNDKRYLHIFLWFTVFKVNPVVLSVCHNPVKVEDIITCVFKQDSKMALAISQAENGTRQCNRIHVNKNGTLDYGVFQVNSIHGSTELLDCRKNIEVAYQIFKKSGWSPWVTFKNGAYKKYLWKYYYGLSCLRSWLCLLCSMAGINNGRMTATITSHYLTITVIRSYNTYARNN